VHIADFLTPDAVACNVVATSKKSSLEQISQLLTQTRISSNQHHIFNCLIHREKLGSTGLGKGVAIPHGRLKDSSIAVGAFMRLAKPIDYDAIDQQPVDLIFALLVPEESNEDHLKMLAQLAEIFSNQTFCQELRQIKTSAQLYQKLCQWQPSSPSGS
jgi:nitrogen PTS system EIIA component